MFSEAFEELSELSGLDSDSDSDSDFEIYIKCPEARSFSKEVLAEARLPLSSDPNHPEASQLSSLSQRMVQLANELLMVSTGVKQIVEGLYCELSCVVSEFRYLRSLLSRKMWPEPEQKVKRQRFESVQQLPNELVLRSLQFRGQSVFRVFPQLSRSTLQRASSSPDSLGVLALTREGFPKLARLPKPRCVGLVDVSLGCSCLIHLLHD